MTKSVDISMKNNVSARSFTPAFGLKNRHLQTILSSQWPRKAGRERRFKKYQREQQSLLFDGGQGCRLQGYYNQAAEQTGKQLVILIHGWEGCHESIYIQSMATTLLNDGYDVLRLNLRDHGDTHHLNKEVFNSTLIDEVMNAIADIQSRLDYPSYSLVGFSLGGNFALRVAANAHDKAINLEQVVAFCPVVHAAQSNAVLNQPRNFIYGKYFVRKWRRSLRKKRECWPEYDFGPQLETFKTLDQMNLALIPKYTSYSDLDSYFDAYAIDGDKMANTICPCYLHFAEDDMIIPIEGVQLLADNPDLHVTVTKHGGHCGYLMNWQGDSWQDSRTLEILNASKK